MDPTDCQMRPEFDLFRATVEQSPDAIIVADRVGVIRVWNGAAEALFGFSADEAIGSGLDLIVPEKFRRSHWDGFRRAVERGRVNRAGEVRTTRSIHRDGRKLYVDLSFGLVKSSDDTVVGAMAIARECSARRLAESTPPPRSDEAIANVADPEPAEDDLRRQAARLSEADRRKNEFLGMLAHELRNPLGALQTGLQVMRLAMQDSLAAGRNIAMMERQITRAVGLVDDLLDVTRISRGEVGVSMQRAALGDILARSVECCRSLAEANHHEVKVFIPAEPILLELDPGRIEQVLVNLLSNAVKYTPAGGHIELKVWIERDEAVVSITDDGAGIPSSALPTIFDLYAQVDERRDRSHGGLGIGLALVRRFVELHGGSVCAASAGLGQGSTFAIRLPLHRQANDESAKTLIADKDGNATGGG